MQILGRDHVHLWTGCVQSQHEWTDTSIWRDIKHTFSCSGSLNQETTSGIITIEICYGQYLMCRSRFTGNQLAKTVKTRHQLREGWPQVWLPASKSTQLKSIQYHNLKGQPGALKLPHTQGPGRGPTIWCIVRSLTLFLHKRLFQDLNLWPFSHMTIQYHNLLKEKSGSEISTNLYSYPHSLLFVERFSHIDFIPFYHWQFSTHMGFSSFGF